VQRVPRSDGEDDITALQLSAMIQPDVTNGSVADVHRADAGPT
jgi:hypothetical protein